MFLPHPHRSRRITDSAGFTLVELLVVIGVLAIIASIAFPIVTRATASARDSKCISNLRQLAISINLYRADHKGLPPHPLDTVKNSYENRSAWEYGNLKAVGLGCLQYEGYLDSNRAGISVTGDNRSPVFHCPERDSGNGWAYTSTNWIDYSYLVTGIRYQPVLDPGLAVATDVTGGQYQKAGDPVHGVNANVAYADGSVSKLPYATYSSPDRSAESFDRRR
ncbi:MAG TPA: type II secretion system protein [Rariglobus sp.]